MSGLTHDALVETMARAIYLRRYEHQGGVWEAVEPRYQRDVWGADARAALAAIREAGAAVVPVGLLREAAEDIAGYVTFEYAVSTGGPHPAVARKYERDMELPRRLLAAAQEDQR